METRLKRPNRAHWTKEEKELLKQYYPGASIEELEKMLGHNANAIRNKAFRMGMSRLREAAKAEREKSRY